MVTCAMFYFRFVASQILFWMYDGTSEIQRAVITFKDKEFQCKLGETFSNFHDKKCKKKFYNYHLC